MFFEYKGVISPFPFFSIISIVVLFFHSLLNFTLCNILSTRPRFRLLVNLLVCFFNALLAPVFFSIHYFAPALPYFLCISVLVLEFTVLFEGKFSTKLGVALGSLLHLFVLRAIIVSSFSIVNSISMLEVLSTSEYYTLVNLFSFASQLVTLTLFIKLIPLKTVKIIMNNTMYYKGLLLLTFLLVVYMAYNSYFFVIDFFSINVAIQEIVISLLVLSFFYIMILMLIRIFNLRIYEEKTKELETKIDKDKTLAAAVFNYASIIMEINCSRDTVERLLVNSTEMAISHLPSVDDFFEKHIELYVHPKDKKMMGAISSLSLISNYEQGIREKEYEYRAKKLKPASQQSGVQVESDTYFWYKMRISTGMNADSTEVISFITVDEIHDEKEEELELRLKAETDPLTGAYNRNAFTEKINKYLTGGRKGALYMFDLDNFKGINDNMGHSAGDAVLQEVCSKTSKLFRNRDIVGRIGGDEFVVFLEGTVEKDVIEEKAQALCKTINKKYYAENQETIEISASVGISIAPKDGMDFETLFNAADLAMYKSKDIGKNAYTFYSTDINGEFSPQTKDAYTRNHQNLQSLDS